MLEIKHLSYQVEGESGEELGILNDVSLTVADHQFVVITGPNGGGKTTLADTVCGTAAFTTGHMCVTLDCSMQYLAPASGARITCTATPRKLGKTVLVYEAVLTDDTGRTVATGVYTFFAKGPAN